MAETLAEGGNLGRLSTCSAALPLPARGDEGSRHGGLVFKVKEIAP
jgi:hypothetical protein